MTMGDRYRHAGPEADGGTWPGIPGRHAAERRVCCGTLPGTPHGTPLRACLVFAPDGTPLAGPPQDRAPFAGRGI